ncbi:hypothetical protein [Bradyrhizobium sp.]
MSPRKAKPKKPPTPKTSKPWDIRPTQPTGSPSDDDVYLAVGKALTAWEGIEIRLSEMYLLFIGRYYSNPKEYRQPVIAALRAYGSITNFTTRAEMVESAADSFFHSRSSFFPLRRAIEDKLIALEKALEDEFKSLMTETRNFVARRNDIAHGVVHGPKGYFLSPPDYNTRKYPRSRDGKLRTIFDTATYHYTSDDIDYYRQHFVGLQVKIAEFIKRGVILLSNDRGREQEQAARFGPR